MYPFKNNFQTVVKMQMNEILEDISACWLIETRFEPTSKSSHAMLNNHHNHLAKGA